MKKSLLVALAMLFAISSFGQKIRFSDSTNVWTLLYTSLDPGSNPVFTSWISPISYSGSVMINSNRYLKLESYYIREDTTAKKVFIRSASDSVDKLLYDYNWAVGDTENSYQITFIDSTMINSLWYKTWHFNGDFNVIEGIGCTNGYEFAAYPNFGFHEYSRQLICFQNRDVSPPLSTPVSSWGAIINIEFDDSASCAMHPLDINRPAETNSNISVVPNPIAQSSKIIFSDVANGKIMIVNDIGQAIETIPFQNTNEVLIGGKIKLPGIYFYHVTDNENGKVYSGKLIKQ